MQHPPLPLAAPIALSLLASCATPAASTMETAPAREVAIPAFEVIVLEHADAAEMASVITDFIDDATAGADEADGPKVLADPRTNSLLVLADDERMVQIKTLVTRLDLEK